MRGETPVPLIEKLVPLEILDSRGNPTVRCACFLEGGAKGTCAVPSGASTGRHEAIELRDGEVSRYHGLGCRKAVAHISGEIQDSLVGVNFTNQAELDHHLTNLDGTSNLSRLGANSILAVSLAFASASAAARQIPLHAYFADLHPADLDQPQKFPLPTINLFSGGIHGGKQVAIQDVLLVPKNSCEFPVQLESMSAVYRSAVDFIASEYGMRNLTADEGGLAPPFPSSKAMLDGAMECARRAGLEADVDFALAVDAAASHFYENGRYTIDGNVMDANQLIDVYEGWAEEYPLYSLEDGLAEDDWSGWQRMQERLVEKTIILGDDLLCTNQFRIEQAIEKKAANALLLKVNQIGTLSGALTALKVARSAGWHIVVSARSGETEDSWLADLAVGWSAQNIKVGSITQSERLSKYNRLLEIYASKLGSTGDCT